MTREDIIRMAQECQLIGMRPHLDGIYQECLEHFAALVAAAAKTEEREACAKVCDDLNNWYTPKACAAHIRARGETK